ncbi:DUF952 domain-containing protein [Amycolatopsis sp.]|uniref:DUF952 domain-containing protein n=1 Tax=Amycolatopsis sp. TaxID=37632 RepID=UPI002BEB2A83|nr:DUF952 domain-containing protein [Amycolatopsis sp.]HVV13524.1 DUF952 domain-containing protein [Amycolatopsis sp.]
MILHICAEGDWTGGEYRPPSLDTAGFVHCSDPGTTHLPANALYAGRTDLVLLEIDPARLGVPLRWEEGDPPHPAGIWFPHVYGPIRPDAVVAVHPFPPEADGSFRLPAAIAVR